MESKTTIIVFSIASILAIGLISSPAYASFTAFQENFVHVEWNNVGNAGPIGPTGNPAIDSDQNSAFNLYTTGGFQTTMECTTISNELICTFKIVDFVDDLESKLILVDITYNTGQLPSQQSSQPTVDEIKCFDNAPSPGTDGIVVLGLVDPDDSDSFIFDLVCRPNPDWEKIVINFHQASPGISLIEFWTESFDDPPIGGTFIPLDTTALLLAGAQSVSMWMIPVVVAGIGIGVFVIKRRE